MRSDHFGERLRRVRVIRGYSQEYVANSIGVHQYTYSAYERQKNPPIELRRLALEEVLEHPFPVDLPPLSPAETPLETVSPIEPFQKSGGKSLSDILRKKPFKWLFAIMLALPLTFVTEYLAYVFAREWDWPLSVHLAVRWTLGLAVLITAIRIILDILNRKID